MSIQSKWDKVRKRSWDEIRDAWLADVPSFPTLGASPEPGLERLSSLLIADIPKVTEAPVRLTDVDGLRRNALWEAVFLFHKCSHTHLAAQRLGHIGMHSWCMFNAYHSAYLGARGILALLGVQLPNLLGKQVALDLFPEPLRRKASGGVRILPVFNDFLIIRLPTQLDQQGLWEGFQRLLRISTVTCWDIGLRNEVLGISSKEITPPRNRFLYHPQYWPLADLMDDQPIEELKELIGDQLDVDGSGFLLRLGFTIYRLFEQLISDLANLSPIVQSQVDGSRAVAAFALPEFGAYRSFLSQTDVRTRDISL